MKVETKNGKTIMVFKDVEELKWHYHKKLCKGDVGAQYYMEQCVKEKDVNKWLKSLGEPCRVEET